jgi:hypothetical protein
MIQQIGNMLEKQKGARLAEGGGQQEKTRTL